MTFAFILAFGALALAWDAYRHYRRDLDSRRWSIALAEVIETPAATTIERDGTGFHWRHGIHHALRWHIDGAPYTQALKMVMSFDINGWVLWQRPLGRTPWRVRYDPAAPMRYEIETEVRMWRWHLVASITAAIAAIITFAAQ